MSYKGRIASIAFLLALCGLLFSGTTGKISGTITDADTGEPLIGANVKVFDSSGEYIGKGAATDWDGNYFIIGISPGTYTIKISYVGYSELSIQNVFIQTDRTTPIDAELSGGVEVIKEVVVTTKRAAIEMDLTSTKQFASGEEISKMAVESVDDVLETKVGVVKQGDELHFRGSRNNEQIVYVDGMPVQDPASGSTNMQISTGAVQEVSMATGAFSAEFGGAMSAVVNIVTKEGNPNVFAGNASYSTDDFGIKSLNRFSDNYDRLDFSFSGPEPITNMLLPLFGLKMPRDKRISYYFSVSGTNTDSYLTYNRKYDFDDDMYSRDFNNSSYDIDYGWYGFFSEKRKNSYSVTLKLKQKVTPNIKLTAAYNGTFSREYLWEWYYNYTPQSATIAENSSHQFLLSMTHTLSPSTFYELKFSRYISNVVEEPGGYTPGDFAIDTLKNALDGWVDLNHDGIANVRQAWDDENGNGMWDYGEPFSPRIEKADTFYDSGEIDFIDTIAVDTLPPQLGEEPWDDENDNGVFEPALTNRHNQLYQAEPFLDGEPFRDGYSVIYDPVTGSRTQIDYSHYGFIDDTLWVDVNGNNRKDVNEFVFGTYYSNTVIPLEEETWNDLDHDRNVDEGEYIDIDGNGMMTYRSGVVGGIAYPDFNDLNGNGIYEINEPGEPFLDLNGNGRYDFANNVRDEWESYIDLNDNGKWDTEDEFLVRGFRRWGAWKDRTTTVTTVKGDLTSQINQENQIKTGFEFSLEDIEMASIQYPEAYYDGIPDGGAYPHHGTFRAFYERTPKKLALYVTDKMEYGGLIANIGFRADMMFQASEVLEDSVENRLLEILGSQIGNEIVKSQSKISPRLGISYPVTERSKLFFNYGHFYQAPTAEKLYAPPTMGSSAVSEIGNPSLDFEKTVSYEIGVAYQPHEVVRLTFSGYYKDVYNLLNTTTRRVGNTQQTVYENLDYARSRGLEFQFNKLSKDYWSLDLSYVFAYAYGKSSSSQSSYNASLDRSSIPLQDLPLNWDIRHNIRAHMVFSAGPDEYLNLFGLKMPDKWLLSLTCNYRSGEPYTPSIDNPHWDPKPGEKAWERTNALRKSDFFSIDLKFQKDFELAKLDWSFVAQVNNLGNIRNIRSVYETTGEPDDADPDDGIGNGRDFEQIPYYLYPPTSLKVALALTW